MVNIEPHIEVYDVERITNPVYGAAGKVAVIGAFPSSTFKIGVFDDVENAKKAVVGSYKLPNDNSIENANKTVVPTSFTSFYCIDHCFIKNNTTQSTGAESILLVNTNYGKGTLVYSSSNSDIADAFTLLAEEDFDILTFAEPLSIAAEDNSTYILNPLFQTIKSFVNTQFFNQKPFGIITGLDFTNATITILASFKELFQDKGFFKAVSTPVQYLGEATSLTIAQSGCWHAAFTAGRPVNKSETAKTYEGIIGGNTKDLFPLAGTITWKDLLDNGFHTTKYKNRRLQTVQCISNITPADYDMKIERIKNYMIKRLTLQDYLGDDNSRITREYVEGLFEYERDLAIENDYIVDMDYTLKAINTETVKAEIILYINDIIRVIVLNVSVAISMYTTEEEA